MRSGTTSRDVCVPPETEPAVGVRNADPIVGEAFNAEDRAGQGVLRPTAVAWRAEPCVAPGSGPLGERIGLGAVCGLLVTDQCPVRGVRSIDAVLPANLPDDLVATQEGEVNAVIAGGLHLLTLV